MDGGEIRWAGRRGREESGVISRDRKNNKKEEQKNKVIGKGEKLFIRVR